MGSVSEFLNTPEKEKIWHGNHNKNVRGKKLRAGDLSMIFENGTLRYISVGNNELIRMIYSAVRDKDWLTINPLIEAEKIEENKSSFTITFRCLYHSGAMTFMANYVFEGRQDNSIILTMEGEALTIFEKNRIGFCVLHPIEGCAGRNCVIEHTDGSSEQSQFPEEISPHQVFRDIKSMRWLLDSINCRLDFEGDVFETEDQRNWTDASYKTYSTPLSSPYPVILEKDTRIFQKVEFRAEGSFDLPETQEEQTEVRLIPEESFKLPLTGICQSSRNMPLSKNEINILRALDFDHYRVDLHLLGDNWIAKAEQACNESSTLGTSIEFALFFDEDIQYQIKSFIRWYSENKLKVSKILLYDKSEAVTPDHLARTVIPLIREITPEVKIATGTNANFAQLNRNRPGNTGNDHICYSIHPQEHASDNKTLIENLKGQEYTVNSARIIAGRKGITVSPVTLQRRFNANNTFLELPWTDTEIPPQVDNRIMSLFGACWTVGSLKYLSEAGADSITIYETTGERGIIQGSLDSPWPPYFPSLKEMIFPVYFVFKFLHGNKTLRIIKSISSRPLIIESLVLTDGKKVRAILVNFASSVQSVKLYRCSGLLRIRTLCPDSYPEAALNYRWTGVEEEKIIKSLNTFTLEPHSINFIEGWIKH